MIEGQSESLKTIRNQNENKKKPRRETKVGKMAEISSDEQSI